MNSGRVPHVVLCSERQLNEIKAFCFDKQCGSVLSFDKTYNLGSLYVTLGVYRNLALQRVGSGDIPIFIGPIFIHGNSDFATYAHFLVTYPSSLLVVIAGRSFAVLLCGPLRSFAVLCGPLRSFVVLCGPLRSFAVLCGF